MSSVFTTSRSSSVIVSSITSRVMDKIGSNSDTCCDNPRSSNSRQISKKDSFWYSLII